jgi:hypothetical protein
VTAAPDALGADERRIRHQLRTRGVGYAPQPSAAPARPRDWLDDYMDAEDPVPRTAVPPPEPPPPPKTVARDHDGGEPRWDWRRLLHWPAARFACGACTALATLFHGESAATGWGSVLRQARDQAGVGPAWVIAGVGAAVAAVILCRRAWYSYALLTCAFIGTVAMASPLDLVRLVTGAF